MKSSNHDTEHIKQQPELTFPCKSCDSLGGKFTNGKWIECDVCHGKGEIITDKGREILDFVYKHFDGIKLAS
jgi:DnaJ-class molecular chaperone